MTCNFPSIVLSWIGFFAESERRSLGCSAYHKKQISGSSFSWCPQRRVLIGCGLRILLDYAQIPSERLVPDRFLCGIQIRTEYLGNCQRVAVIITIFRRGSLISILALPGRPERVLVLKVVAKILNALHPCGAKKVGAGLVRSQAAIWPPICLNR
jgi:hypothetical protein